MSRRLGVWRGWSGREIRCRVWVGVVDKVHDIYEVSERSPPPIMCLVCGIYQGLFKCYVTQLVRGYMDQRRLSLRGVYASM